METANSKRRGFLKNKLVKPLAQLAKPLPLAHGGGSKVKPSPSASRDCPDECYSMARRGVSNLSSTPSVRIGSIAKANIVIGSTFGYPQQSSHHGDEENVDLKAASYIYNVRERFRLLEGVGSNQAYYPEKL